MDAELELQYKQICGVYTIKGCYTFGATHPLTIERGCKDGNMNVVSFVTNIAAALFCLLYLNSLHHECTVFTRIKAFFQKCAICINSGISNHDPQINNKYV